MVLLGAPAAEIAGSLVFDSAWQLSAVLVAFASATNSFPLDVPIGAPIKAWGVVSPLIARPEAASSSWQPLSFQTKRAMLPTGT